MSGYDMQSIIQKSIGHFWAESNGQLYPTLNHLEKEHLIAREERKERGKKQKKTYSITEEGRQTLHVWLEETADQKGIHRDEGLLKLFFGSNRTIDGSINLLKQRKKRVEKKLSEFLAIQEEIKNLSDSPHYLYWTIALRNGIKASEADIAWCRESIQTLKSAQGKR